ncbi:MAG TPA: hypothetical protein VMM76_07560 [Pirellulaceae bacterium]|nr:hypothetical protein [Pirellulaceae bacterium]
MAKNIQFQFGIRRLIILTSAVAVVMAVSVRLDAPQVAQWAFAAYLALFVGWAVMRGPNMYAKFIEARARRHQLMQRRSELESEAAELRLRSQRRIS